MPAIACLSGVPPLAVATMDYVTPLKDAVQFDTLLAPLATEYFSAAATLRAAVYGARV
jgi:hypothetical protein